MRAPSGCFSPEWLYYKGRLWHQPTIELHEGEVLSFSPQRIPGIPTVEGLLSPCWINAHTHLELSHLRGRIPPGRGMIDFIERMGPHRGQASAEIIRAALIEALNEGTCGFVSHQNVRLPPDAIPEGVVVQPLGEYLGLRLKGSFQRYVRIRKLGYPLTPHSFYALSRSLSRKARRSQPFPLSIHFFESLEEKLWLEGGKGVFFSFLRRFVRHPRPPLWQKHLRRLYHHASALWLVHSTEIPSPLMESLLRRFPRIFAVLCPDANAYLFRRFPDWNLWRKYPERILIGTDSLANSPSLSVWHVIRRLWMAGFSWENIFLAAVDTPRRWLSPPPLWVQIAPLGSQGEILPSTQARIWYADRAFLAQST